MGIILTILLGALVGWIASIIMRRNDQQNGFQNVLVGVGGALIGGLISWLVGGSDRPSPWISFNIVDVLWALLGAIALCAVVNYFQRGQIR